MMVRAVILHQILWPQRQEDRNEGGWVEGDERLRSVDREREVMLRRASMVQRRLNGEAKVVERRRTEVEVIPEGQPVGGKKRASRTQGGREDEEEREPEFDRADFAIKEAQKESGLGPVRGRRGRSATDDKV
jgi:hypothetical protein